jgi:hypothetical protein
MISLSIVLCWEGGGKTRCVTLSRGHRLRIFSNAAMKKIFGHMKEDISGNWRKLLAEEVYNSRTKLNITLAIESISLYERGMWHVWIEEKHIQGFGGEM